MEHQGVQQAFLELYHAMGPLGWIIAYVVLSYVGSFFCLRNLDPFKTELETGNYTRIDLPPACLIFLVAPISFLIFLGPISANISEFILHIGIKKKG